MLHTLRRPDTPLPAAPRAWRLGLVAMAAALALSACNQGGGGTAASAPAAAPAAQAQQPDVQTAYTPPSAEVLYQMVAPIALYPDRLVAQILAGATYPDQVAAAEAWLAQNPGLRNAALGSAANAEPWDPSVKSLTQFPNVLAQMAANLPWTTALGKAYYADPADVMNAIQVLRGRAYKAGSLQNASHLKVRLVAQAQAPGSYEPVDTAPPIPVSAPAIALPTQFIQIEPSEPSTVYVPQYDPTMVYGAPVPVYGGYRYVTAPPPPPAVVVGGNATPVVAGLIGFGVGVAVSAVIDHGHPWGWDAWHLHWGDPGVPGYWRAGMPPPAPLARPAVVYNNRTYVSNSTTVVQNIRNVTNDVRVTHDVVGAGTGRAAPAAALPSVQSPVPPSVPHLAGPAMAAGTAATVAGVAAATAPRQPPAAHANAMAQMPPPHGPGPSTEQEQARQRQIAQEHAQQERLQQAAQQEQAHQQQIQQRAQEEHLRQQQQSAQQQQRIAQQARQVQERQERQEQQTARQHAELAQRQAQQAAPQQQRGQQEQLRDQQMREHQVREREMAQQRAHDEPPHPPSQPAHPEHQERAAHPRPHEDKPGSERR